SKLGVSKLEISAPGVSKAGISTPGNSMSDNSSIGKASNEPTGSGAGVSASGDGMASCGLGSVGGVAKNDSNSSDTVSSAGRVTPCSKLSRLSTESSAGSERLG